MKLTHSTTVRKEKFNTEAIQAALTEADHTQNDLILKRWEEAIFHENHIIPRSYHSATVYKSMLFVFGGYEYNQGILNDLVCLDLECKEPFIWKTIEKPKGVYPEPLHRHSALTYQDKMYIYGGKTSVLTNSKKLYSYEFATNTWIEEKSGKEKKEDIVPFAIDSHNVVLFEDNFSAEMIVFGGFLGKYSKYSNNVFAYDFKKQEWKFYYKHESKKENKTENSLVKAPKKRANSSMILMRNALFIFGGCKGTLKMNDFWKFDLMTSTWKEILYDKKITPEPRSGQIFLPVQKDIFLLFGGIHDIAHEKNDVLCYEESMNQWFKVEEDSMKNLSDDPKKLLSFHKNMEKSTEKSMHQLTEKNKTINTKHKKTNSVYYLKSSKKTKTEMSRKLSTEHIFETNTGGKSPDQLKEARMKKEKHMKKMLLLSEFEVNDEARSGMIINSPTTEAMKNSILAVKGDAKFFEHNRLKHHHKENSINNIMVNSSSNTIKGKKPCARDGCSGNVFHDKIVIFGGDRHLMAFHDLYFLNFKHLI